MTQNLKSNRGTGLAAAFLLGAALLPSSPAQAFQSILASPNYVQFGDVRLGSRVFAVITLQNLGDEDISFVNLFEYGDRREFNVWNTCGYLSRYGSCSIRVEFAPTHEGRFSADLDIVGGTARATVAIYGEGRAP